MNDRITHSLTKLFVRHRIIFWYDAKKELRSQFEALELSDVEKLVLDNNELGIKYRILREFPDLEMDRSLPLLPRIERDVVIDPNVEELGSGQIGPAAGEGLDQREPGGNRRGDAAICGALRDGRSLRKDPGDHHGHPRGQYVLPR